MYALTFPQNVFITDVLAPSCTLAVDRIISLGKLAATQVQWPLMTTLKSIL